MDKKRLVLIGIFLLATLGIGFLLYIVFFKTSTPKISTNPGQQTTQTGKTSDLPTAGQRTPTLPTQKGNNLPSTSETRPTVREDGRAISQVEQLIQSSIIQPKVNADGTLAFYNKQDGHFYKVNANGDLELLSDQVFFNVQNVTWSPTDNKSIIEYPDGSNIYYDFTAKKQVTLPKQWEEFSFEKGGGKIAAKSIGLSPENRWIVTAEPEGTNIKLIAGLGENAKKVNVNWSPNKQVIATSQTGEAIGGDRQEILLIGLNGENFPALTVEGRGFDSSWSPQGEKLLYSVYSARSDFKPELWIVDANATTVGDNRKLLNVNTWPEKCSFTDDRFVYCGVPQDLKTGAGIAPSVADTTPDLIYRIDTETGIKTEIPLDTSGHVVQKMFVGADGKTLYFTDKNQAGLFKVAL